MAFKETDIETIWNAVYDTEALNSDPDVARNLADQVKQSLVTDNKRMLMISQKELQQARQKMVNTLLHTAAIILYWIAGFIVAGAITFGVYSIFQHNNGDYAGYGPSKVNKHDAKAIAAYLFPKNLLVVNRKKSHAPTGESAWATTYRVDNKTLCVYVWGGNGKDEFSKVNEGSCP